MNLNLTPLQHEAASSRHNLTCVRRWFGLYRKLKVLYSIQLSTVTFYFARFFPQTNLWWRNETFLFILFILPLSCAIQQPDIRFQYISSSFFQKISSFPFSTNQVIKARYRNFIGVDFGSLSKVTHEPKDLCLSEKSKVGSSLLGLLLYPTLVIFIALFFECKILIFRSKLKQNKKSQPGVLCFIQL